MFLDRYLLSETDLTDCDVEGKIDFEEKILQDNSKLKNNRTNKLAGRGNILPSIMCKVIYHFPRDLFSACKLQLEILYIYYKKFIDCLDVQLTNPSTFVH